MEGQFSAFGLFNEWRIISWQEAYAICWNVLCGWLQIASNSYLFYQITAVVNQMSCHGMATESHNLLCCGILHMFCISASSLN